MRVIPWQNGPRWRAEVTLDGEPYIVRAAYNVESQAWTLGLYTLSDDPIVLGIKLVKGQPLLAQTRRDNSIPGELVVVGEGLPTRGNMGDGCNLIYVTGAELAAI